MAVVSKEDILKQIKGLLGDNTSDDALKLIEDITDTLDAHSTGEDVETLKKQIKDLESDKEELDKTWREKYRERFFNVDPKGETKVDPEEDPSGEEVEDNEPQKFEDLFATE